MIYIDCRPGSNGSFLEFVGNVFMAGVPVSKRNIIKEPDAFWEQDYHMNKEFRSDTYAIHQAYLKERYAFAYESWGVDYIKNVKVIRITLEDSDLMPLLWQTLNTPSQHGCAPDNLETNTFNKLNCAEHMPLLQSLQSYFLDEHTISAYNSVKAEHWPDINSPEDFKSVPIEIKAECKVVYNINLYGRAFTKDNADCPRYIIRDMFKQMFKDPAETDYIRIGKTFKFDESNEIRSFPFSAFYNKDTFAIIPLGFCYPGKGKSGDLPPRKECAPKWHPQLFKYLKNIELVLLVGSYAQQYYLQKDAKSTLTETVKAYNMYLPRFLPLPHPSPRNNIWLKKNDWFKADLLPDLKERIQLLIA